MTENEVAYDAETGEVLDENPTAVATTEPRRSNELSRQDTLSIDALVNQTRMIQEAISKVMKEDTDYGTIPGTTKPTLYQSGAQKLGVMFRLRSEIECEERFGPAPGLNPGHLEVVAHVKMIHIPTGQIWAEGIGSCSSMESKYRYRSSPPVSTGKAVPKDYWNARKAGDQATIDKLIGKGMRVGKDEESGQWVIMKPGEGTVENPDIADVYNTVRKIAAKRATVAATINATAVSDFFTQDLEDMSEEQLAGIASSSKKKSTTKKKTGEAKAAPSAKPAGQEAARQEAQPRPEPVDPPHMATEEDMKRFENFQHQIDIANNPELFNKWIDGTARGRESLPASAQMELNDAIDAKLKQFAEEASGA